MRRALLTCRRPRRPRSFRGIGHRMRRFEDVRRRQRRSSGWFAGRVDGRGFVGDHLIHPDFTMRDQVPVVFKNTTTNHSQNKKKTQQISNINKSSSTKNDSSTNTKNKNTFFLPNGPSSTSHHSFCFHSLHDLELYGNFAGRTMPVVTKQNTRIHNNVNIGNTKQSTGNPHRCQTIDKTLKTVH